MRLLQPGRQANLAREALHTQSFGELRGEHLDDHIAPESVLARHEHAAHPSAAELARERVARAERHLESVA